MTPSLAVLVFINGATGDGPLTVEFDPYSYDGSRLYLNVRAKIVESSQKVADRLIPVKASVLREICETFLKWQTEINDILARSEKCPSPRKTS